MPGSLTASDVEQSLLNLDRADGDYSPVEIDLGLR